MDSRGQTVNPGRGYDPKTSVTLYLRTSVTHSESQKKGPKPEKRARSCGLWHFDRMSKGWVIGSKEFKKELINEHKEAEAKIDLNDREMAEVREMVLRERLEELLRRVGKTEGDVAADRKSVPWKLAVAAAMKWGTTVSNRWLAENLQMGSLPELSRQVNAW